MRQYEKFVFLTQYYGVCLWSETAAVTYKKIMNDVELNDIDETRRAGAEMLDAKRAATIFSTMARLFYDGRMETLDWKDMEAELQKNRTARHARRRERRLPFGAAARTHLQGRRHRR